MASKENPTELLIVDVTQAPEVRTYKGVKFGTRLTAQDPPNEEWRRFKLLVAGLFTRRDGSAVKGWFYTPEVNVHPHKPFNGTEWVDENFDPRFRSGDRFTISAKYKSTNKYGDRFAYVKLKADAEITPIDWSSIYDWLEKLDAPETLLGYVRERAE